MDPDPDPWGKKHTDPQPPGHRGELGAPPAVPDEADSWAGAGARRQDGEQRGGAEAAREQGHQHAHEQSALQGGEQSERRQYVQPAEVPGVSYIQRYHFNVFKGLFDFFKVLYSTLLHLPPLRFHRVGEKWSTIGQKLRLCLTSYWETYRTYRTSFSFTWKEWVPGIVVFSVSDLLFSVWYQCYSARIPLSSLTDPPFGETQILSLEFTNFRRCTTHQYLCTHYLPANPPIPLACHNGSMPQRLRPKRRCCGSEIWCFFDPWIPNPYFWELSDNFWGKNYCNSLSIGRNFFCMVVPVQK